MIVLGFDTATAATAVAVLDDGQPDRARERHHAPAAGERPGHAAQLLTIAAQLLDAAGLRFADVDRIAVGVGPGTFTGLRIGVATARALAQSSSAELVGVSTLRALAVAAESNCLAVSSPGLDMARQTLSDTGVLAVIDARRGEAFAAGWRAGAPVIGAAAYAPQVLARVVAADGGPWLAVGDGALRFRADLEGAGCDVPADGSARHVVSARAICELALRTSPQVSRDLVLPDYLRLPDAVLAATRRSAES